MRYLKGINEEFKDEFNNWVKSEILKHINFRLLSDIKDMSLEYIDDNLALEVSVMYPFSITNKNKFNYKREKFISHKIIYHISYSHTKKNEEFLIDNIRFIHQDCILDTISNISDNKFVYTINLTKDYDDREEVGTERDYVSYHSKTLELKERVIEAYPNTNIVV